MGIWNLICCDWTGRGPEGSPRLPGLPCEAHAALAKQRSHQWNQNVKTAWTPKKLALVELKSL
jgi:hypothetical protein